MLIGNHFTSTSEPLVVQRLAMTRPLNAICPRGPDERAPASIKRCCKPSIIPMSK